MGITVDKDSLSVSVQYSEQISFDTNVKCLYDNYINEIKEELNNYDEDEVDAIKMKEIISYELTDEDKFGILKEIADDFEYERFNNGDYNASIYDEDIIKSAIRNYLEIKFEISLW